MKSSMASRESFYEMAERRIELLSVAVGATATLGVAIRWGWRAAAGFGIGASLAWVNYRWLKQGATAMTQLAIARSDSPKVRIPTLVYVKFFGRFVLVVAVVYVILARSSLPVVAVLAGLFTLVAAILIELVYELFRGAGQADEN
jgi:hypothetical protein